MLPPAAKPEEHGLDKPTVVQVDTFDNLIYTVKIGAKSGEDYPVNIRVSANFPKDRVVGKDEKPDEKATADKGWQEQLKRWQDKLKHEKTFESWTYLMPGWNVDAVLKERKDLLAEKKDESKKDEKASATDEKKDDSTPGFRCRIPCWELRPRMPGQITLPERARSRPYHTIQLKVIRGTRG